MLGPYLCSVQIRETALDQPFPFISCSINDMKSLTMDFINKQTEGLVRRNAFSVGIDEIKVVKGVRLYQHYNAIVGGFHPKDFCVDGMTKVDLHDHIEVMRSDKNKSDRAGR